MFLRTITAAGMVLALATQTWQIARADDVRSEIEAVNQKWDDTFNRKDAAGLAALYTADAKLLPPAKVIISGTDDIKQFWEKSLQAGFADHTIKIIEVQTSGNLAYQASRWTVTGPGKDGGRVTIEGKLVSVLERQPDGTWKARLHSWNAAP